MSQIALNRFVARRKKWDHRFLGMARHIASWSKDPSTKVGAVLVRPDMTVAATGYNGYPKGMHDLLMDNRTEKYSRIIHAEMNALHFCKDQSVLGYTLYTWPMLCCDRCAVHVIQAGIKRVVSTSYDGDGRWAEQLFKALQYFRSCEIEVQIYPEKDLQRWLVYPTLQDECPEDNCPLCSSP